MEQSTLQELVKQYGLSRRDYRKPVYDVHLEQISRSSCKDWRSLPSYLGGMDPYIDVEDINCIHGDEREKRHAFFRLWKERNGSGATYEKLINALLEIRCKQDAEKVCKILKDSISPRKSKTTSEQTSARVNAGIEDLSSKSDTASSMEPLNSDTRNDLNAKLDKELQIITQRYNAYVNYIRKFLRAKGVSAKELVSDLGNLSAFNHTRRRRTLLSAHEDELMEAGDLNGVFAVLSRKYASFMNYEIFQYILDYYELDSGQEQFKYPEHLNAYLKKHRVSEFIKINPLLEKFTTTSTSKEFVLKVDIETTSELAKIKNLAETVAKILDVPSAALQLLDIKDGCVVVTFLIPTHVAELIFNKHMVLSDKEVKQFQAESVIWMDCNGCMFNFTEKVPEEDVKLSATGKDVSNSHFAEGISYEEGPLRNFIYEPRDDLKCMICLDVARDPQQHVECGKLFCKVCLERLGRDKPCPSCRTRDSMFYADKKSKRSIQALLVKCSNVDKGCEWEGTVGILEEHLAKCKFAECAHKKAEDFPQDHDSVQDQKKSGLAKRPSLVTIRCKCSLLTIQRVKEDVELTFKGRKVTLHEGNICLQAEREIAAETEKLIGSIVSDHEAKIRSSVEVMACYYLPVLADQSVQDEFAKMREIFAFELKILAAGSYIPLEKLAEVYSKVSEQISLLYSGEIGQTAEDKALVHLLGQFFRHIYPQISLQIRAHSDHIHEVVDKVKEKVEKSTHQASIIVPGIGKNPDYARYLTGIAKRSNISATTSTLQEDTIILRGLHRAVKDTEEQLKILISDRKAQGRI